MFVPPTLGSALASVSTAGTRIPSAPETRPVGSESTTSRVITVWRWVVCTSTVGEAPTTVTVSAISPTDSSISTVAVNVPVSSMPSRRTVLNPARLTVTEYAPGRSAMWR